jgi:predicted O-methyltransferase YrrM
VQRDCQPWVEVDRYIADQLLGDAPLPAYGGLPPHDVSPPHGALLELLARLMGARANLGDAADVIVGPALETLPTLTGPFDLVFIDADKRSNPEYLRWALRLSRPGTLIVADNVVRGGAVVDGSSADPSVVGVRRFFAAVAAEPRLRATAIQTVGAKGYDGFALALVE